MPINAPIAEENAEEKNVWHVPSVVEGAPYATFALALQNLIRAKNLFSVRGAADLTEIDHTSLNSLVKGQKRPTAKVIDKIVDRLGGDKESLTALAYLSRKQSVKPLGVRESLTSYFADGADGTGTGSDNPKGDATVANLIEELNALQDSMRGVEMIPLIGRIAAGSGVLANVNIEAYEPCSADLCHDGNQYFAVRVKGESMEGDHIVEGSVLIVRAQNWASNGDIVAALTGDGDEVTVKRYHRAFAGAWLEGHYANGDRPMIMMNESTRILGVVLEQRRRFV